MLFVCQVIPGRECFFVGGEVVNWRSSNMGLPVSAQAIRQLFNLLAGHGQKWNASRTEESSSRRLRVVVIEHPVDAVFVGAATEVRSPERIFQWHGDFSFLGDLVEQFFCLFAAFCLVGDGEVVVLFEGCTESTWDVATHQCCAADVVGDMHDVVLQSRYPKRESASSG